MSKFLSSRLADLAPYTPGEQPQDQPYIKLNTNESPYPPSPNVLRQLDSAAVSALNLYPDPDAVILRQTLAERYGVEPDQVFVSNGSDEILSFAFMAFCDKEHGAAFPDITYGFYRVYADLYGIPYKEIPLQADFSVSPDSYAHLQPGTMIVIANPNAPTGLCLSPADIASILEANPESLVVIDEAYIDFGGESCVHLCQKYDHLLIVQTFSKSRSMAGARLGFAIAAKPIIEDLNRVKYSTNPYNINRLTMLAGAAALQDAAYYKEKCSKIVENRSYTAGRLREMGFVLTDSMANFLFAAHPRIDGQTLYRQLKARGILIRHFARPRIDQYVRITIGTRDQMDALITALQAILEDTKK